MDIERCDRLDHLGVVSGFLKESKIIDFVDAKFKEHIAENSNITPGQAVAGMIINGLGFANMPLSLTPDFFKNKAVEQMFGEGVKHQDFNQHKLGRTLDQVFAYGCEKFFYEVASLAHQKYQVDSKFWSLDTTSLSLTGEYNVDTKEHEVKIAIPRITGLILSVEMVCSQDGGVPLMVKCFDNESDNNIFQQRAQALIEIFKESEQQKYLVADSKLYSESNAETLKQLQFITRIPATIKLEREAISEALEANNWTQLNKENKYVIKSISHYGIEQRWVVIHSQKAQERSAKTLDKLVEKEHQALVKSIKAIGKQRYHCHNDAQEAAQKIFGKIKYHEMLKVVIAEVDENNSKEDKITEKYAIQDISFAKNPNKIQHTLEQRSCFVLASNIKELTPEELIAGYKGQC